MLRAAAYVTLRHPAGCRFLFREGVLYAEKDFNLPKHPEIDVPNLEVIKLMQARP